MCLCVQCFSPELPRKAFAVHLADMEHHRRAERPGRVMLTGTLAGVLCALLVALLGPAGVSGQPRRQPYPYDSNDDPWNSWSAEDIAADNQRRAEAAAAAQVAVPPVQGIPGAPIQPGGPPQPLPPDPAPLGAHVIPGAHQPPHQPQPWGTAHYPGTATPGEPHLHTADASPPGLTQQERELAHDAWLLDKLAAALQRKQLEYQRQQMMRLGHSQGVGDRAAASSARPPQGPTYTCGRQPGPEPGAEASPHPPAMPTAPVQLPPQEATASQLGPAHPPLQHHGAGQCPPTEASDPHGRAMPGGATAGSGPLPVGPHMQPPPHQEPLPPGTPLRQPGSYTHLRAHET